MFPAYLLLRFSVESVSRGSDGQICRTNGLEDSGTKEKFHIAQQEKP